MKYTGDQIADLDISGDISPLTPPEYHAFLGNTVALKLSAKRDAGGTLHLENLNLLSQALALTGRAEITPDGWPNSLSLRGTITPPDGPPVLLPLRGEEIYIDQADLTLEFDAARNDGWLLRGQIKHPKRGAFSAATLSLSGQGKIARDTQEVRGDLALAALGLDLGNDPLNQSFGPAIKGKLRFDWRQNHPLVLSDLDLSGIGYGLTGNIAVSGVTELEPKVDTDLFLETLNLAQFSALSGVDLAGAANLKITGEIEPLLGAFDMIFAGAARNLETGVTQLDPVLQGDGQLTLRVTRDTKGTRVMPLEITTPAATVVGTADLKTGRSAIKATVELADAALVHPELTGPATVLLTATQTAQLWQIDLNSRLPADAAVSFTGTLEDMTDVRGTLSAQVGRLAALKGITKQDLSGRAEVELAVTGDLASQQATLDGDATLTAFRIGNPTLDPLMAGTIQLAVKGNLDTDQRITLETLALTGAHVLGSASGHLAKNSSAVDFMLRLPNLGVISREISGAGSVQGTAAHSGGDWRIDVAGEGPGGSTLSVNGTATPSFDRLAIEARGTAPLALANRRLAPQTLTGMLDYDLNLNGAPSLAALSGSAVTRNARLSVPAARLILDQLDARITLGGGQADLTIDTALPDGGSLRITGPISLAAPYQASLAAQLRNATLREPSLFETTANGDLTLIGALTGGARIGGQIDLGRVELRIPQLGPSYSSLSGLKHIDPPSDVARTLRFAGLSQTPGTAPEPSTAFPLDLRITAQNRIFVRGRGLDAELGGDLRLTGTTRNIVPVGQFDLIRGRLDLLRRRLELTEGSISLRGSFDPQLIFAATTQVDDTDITIEISGPASEPDLTVRSSPELPQDQVLALFLFGRDVTSLSALQAVQLASAIRTLTGQGGLGLTQQIRGGLGLDDLDIGTADDGTTQARVGKYISDNIYTDATVKSTGEAQINLNLDLSDTVTVRGRVGSDGDTGIGIFFERDY